MATTRGTNRATFKSISRSGWTKGATAARIFDQQALEKKQRRSNEISSRDTDRLEQLGRENGAFLNILSHAKLVTSLRSNGREGTEKRRQANEVFENRNDIKLIGTGSKGEAFKVDTNGNLIVLKALPCAANSKEALRELLDIGLKEVELQQKAARVCPDGVVDGYLAFSYELPAEAAAAHSIGTISDLRITQDSPAVPPNVPVPSRLARCPTVSFSDENATYRSMLIIAMEACSGSFVEYMKNCKKAGAVIYFAQTLERFRVVCQTVEKLHSNDIEHNDLHSENVFVCKGHGMEDAAPLVGDFGDAQTREDAEKEGSIFGLLDAKQLGGFLHDIIAEFFSENSHEWEDWDDYLSEEKQISPSLLERFNAERFPPRARGGLQRLVDCIVPMITAADCEVVPQCIVAIENALQSLKRA
ncbi:MAG: hypothetical protein SGILL_005353 [Bacillariaceae sp.]